MAERLDKLPERRVGMPRQYPWDEWADGSPWRIYQGRDFESTPSAMASLIRKHAQRSGLKVRALVYDDSVEFQFAEAPDAAA